MTVTHTANNQASWPRVRIVFWDPTRPHETVTIEEAQRRFGIDDPTAVGLRSGQYYSGVGPWSQEKTAEMASRGAEARDVREMHRYTLDDSIRTNARNLLAACECAEASERDGADLYEILGRYGFDTTPRAGLTDAAFAFVRIFLRSAIAAAYGDPA